MFSQVLLTIDRRGEAHRVQLLLESIKIGDELHPALCCHSTDAHCSFSIIWWPAVAAAAAAATAPQSLGTVSEQRRFRAAYMLFTW